MQQVNTLRQAAGHGFLSHIAAAAKFVFREVKQWNDRRKAVRYLHELSDYHLQDLGVRRSEILSVVYGDAPERRRHYVTGR